MRKSKLNWMIINPHNSNEVLHDFGGTVMFAPHLCPVGYMVNGKRKYSLPIIYKTSNGALNRSRKHFPDWREHSCQTTVAIEERTFNNRIYSYRGEWNELSASR